MATPVFQQRFGQIEAAVWENKRKSDGLIWYSVNLVRFYTDDRGIERKAGTFGKNDLLPAAEALRLAWIWVATQTPSDNPSQSEETSSGST